MLFILLLKYNNNNIYLLKIYIKSLLKLINILIDKFSLLYYVISFVISS